MAERAVGQTLRCMVTAILATGSAAAAPAAPILPAVFSPQAAAAPGGVPSAPQPAPQGAAWPASEAIPTGALVRDPAALTSWLAEHNQDLLAAAAQVRQAEAAAAQSRLLINPSLSGSLTDTTGRTNPPGLTFGERSIYGAALSETVEIGKRGPRMRSADLRLQAARQGFLDSLSQKIAEAREILVRLAYLRARQGVLEESLAGARQILDLQKSRLENGDLSGSDYDRLLVDTMVLDAEVARTRAEYEEALTTCRAILFAPCAPPDVDLAGSTGAADVPAAPDPEAALVRRPDLQALDLERSSAEQDAVLARRRLIPDPNVSVGYTRDNLTIAGDQPNTLQLSIGVPLPVFDRGQHEARRARERAAEVERTADAVKARARSEIEALERRKEFLESTLLIFQEQAVPKSKSVLDAAVTAVSQGGMSMTDLLLARRTHTDLLLKVMDLEFDAFSVRNGLRRALGLDAEVARAVLGL